MLKRYIPNAIEGIEATNQTIEGHTRKAVRLHSLAHNCALQLKEKIDKGDLTRFGTTFEYSKVYMGKTIGGEYVTIASTIMSICAKREMRLVIRRNALHNSPMRSQKAKLLYWIFRVQSIACTTLKLLPLSY